MSSATFTVGFYTIKCRGKIDSNYKKLAQVLQENNYNPIKFAEFPLSRNNLASIDILVIPCPDNNKFAKSEIQAIKTWVSQDGGGLLLLSHAGGDKGRRTNLSELSEQFGMIFENNQVLDKYHNLGVENLPFIEEFTIPHPINENLHRIVFRAGCSLSATGMNVTPVISSGPKADPFESPLLLACEDGEGRVVAVGSYEMFRDKISGGINQDDHQQLALNIFSWLKTTHREKIKAGIAPSIPEYPEYGSNNVNSEISANTISGQSSSIQYQPNLTTSPGIIPKKYESTVKILANEDLINAFESTLKEFFNFKQRILNDLNQFETNLALLMKAVLASEKDIIAFKQQQTDSLKQESFKIENQSSVTSTDYSTPKATAPKIENSPKDILTDIQNEFKIANGTIEREPKPETANQQEPPKSTSPSTKMEVKQTRSSIKKQPTQKKSKEDLKKELETLENKLNSIKNLREFVEKKHDEGTLTDKRYEKQIKKLDTDKNTAQARIQEILKILNN
ncbi:MAG: hypothetical protein K9W44_00955 [Candidatus Lokiarchaeota archaeon]|nr:hypothetical protein [Candidatus Harpocratesius repetitus]